MYMYNVYSYLINQNTVINGHANLFSCIIHLLNVSLLLKISVKLIKIQCGVCNNKCIVICRYNELFKLLLQRLLRQTVLY